ncbi:hypothetical protein KOI35_14705 [Actinoplanes bogorensis]|uniref:DUF6891 domain-containing protein n=1 Tax=Paractinoplanes bogorensis TaxID=1610840 RepID=A0ABS5YMR7_9ACTN|nr:hypothetical protein [Actinoplanes bogorensis]MBU2664751.1 hypothetical protein [Actinoplanes bogorensis]
MNDWVYNNRPAGVRFVPERVAEPARTEIEDQIWSWIVRGATDTDDFVDCFDGVFAVDNAELVAAFDAAVAARRTQQQAWGAVTSNLTRAFDELNAAGVLARENFTCCGTCAATEIHDERDDSRHWHGYLWYHQQDAEALAESAAGSVYLGYGAYPPADFDRDAYAALTEDEQQAHYRAGVERLLDDVVFPVLRRHGMEVNWNRKQETRVQVTGARWYAPLA